MNAVLQLGWWLVPIDIPHFVGVWVWCVCGCEVLVVNGLFVLLMLWAVCFPLVGSLVSVFVVIGCVMSVCVCVLYTLLGKQDVCGVVLVVGVDSVGSCTMLFVAQPQVCLATVYPSSLYCSR